MGGWADGWMGGHAYSLVSTFTKAIAMGKLSNNLEFMYKKESINLNAPV